MFTNPTVNPADSYPCTAPSARAPRPETRLPALDGLRGVAILMVMLHHLTIMPTRTGFDATLKGLLGMGVGVELFFVLSGFLITAALLRAKASASGKGRPDSAQFFGRFYLRRVLRLFPLYYLFLVVLLVLLPQFDGPGATGGISRLLERVGWIPGHESAAPWFWLHLSNLPMALRGSFLHESLDVTWSLAVQEQFYLVWPILIYFCPIRRLPLVCLGLVAASLLFRIGAIGWQANPVALYVATPARLGSLAVGSLVAVWHATGAGELSRLGARARAVAALSMVGLAALILPSVQRWSGTGIEEIASIFQRTPLALTLVAAGFGSLLTITLSARPGGVWIRALSSRPLTALGRYSFAMFLFHQPIRAVVRQFLLAPIDLPTLAGSRIPGQVVFFGVCLSITFVAAMASWHLFEKHFLHLPGLNVPRTLRHALDPKGAA